MTKRALGLAIAAMIAGCTSDEVTRLRQALDAAEKRAATPAQVAPSAAVATPTPAPTPQPTPQPTATPAPAPSATVVPQAPLLVNGFDGNDFSIGGTAGWEKSSGNDTPIGDVATLHLVCRKKVDNLQVGFLSVSSWLLSSVPQAAFIDMIKRTMESGNPTWLVERNYSQPYTGFVAKADVVGSLPLKVERYHFFLVNRSESAYVIHFRHTIGAVTDAEVFTMVDSFRMR